MLFKYLMCISRSYDLYYTQLGMLSVSFCFFGGSLLPLGLGIFVIWFSSFIPV